MSIHLDGRLSKDLVLFQHAVPGRLVGDLEEGDAFDGWGHFGEGAEHSIRSQQVLDGFGWGIGFWGFVFEGQVEDQK